MKKRVFLICMFLCMFSVLMLNAQSYPYLSGPGIDVGTVAKAGVEQTYKIKYGSGSATENQNQLVQWKIDLNQCDSIVRHGKTASITLKWKVSGVKGTIEAYNIYTNVGITNISADVNIEPTSISDINITVPSATTVGHTIEISVGANAPKKWSASLQATDFQKTSEREGYITEGYFTSSGLKNITVTFYDESHVKMTEATKSIAVLPANITGDDALAINGRGVYSLLNAPSGSYAWTVSNGLRIVSGQGGPSIIVEATGSEPNGFVNVSSFGISLSKGIAVGVPDINKVTVTLGQNNTLYAYFTNRNECRATYSGSGTILEYEWSSTSWEVFNPLTANKSVVFLKSLYTPASSTANILVRARNAVGWSNKVLLGAQVNNSTSGYSSYNIKNLKNGTIAITKNEQENSQVLNNSNRTDPIYELYNQFTGILVKKGKLTNSGGVIDVSSLPNGIYVISLIVNASNKQTEKVIIQH